ncbi:diacylglycerol/lipid kinase family protein [Suipraeoptans intestinalis]|uniref:diacylglycerol/lipid kinase family protein n=1 Tax=Suipraeoptans intestinalis TaxID=2606628 RepID=UPI0023F12C29|nr:diacylglycerol kinase family protein [Suipraeoptans intestinalis]MDD7770693.1 diacylglycerol kinase family lipid kinase [Suipraeoptans intestinalis]MDY3121405.1 diacylglycerol kinase family lipid kinase [Suipraeoptans intestinalis]
MITFIVNPNARSGLGSRIWKQIQQILQERKVQHQVFFTKYQHHASRIVSQITSDGDSHTLIALGGDGTINEVINGITFLDRVTLGYIPIGSGNDFARSLKLPSDPVTAIEYLLKPSHFTNMDVGVLWHGNKKRRFAVSTGIGFDASVCHEMAVSPLKLLLNKLKLGKLAYAGIAVRRIAALIPQDVELVVDGHKTLGYKNAFFVAVMNQPYEGGGLKFCPRANSHDRRLNALIVSDMSKLKALFLLPLSFHGLHTPFRGVSLLSFQNLEIRTQTPLPLHTDGEPVFLQKQIKVSLEPETLRVMTLV